MYEHVELLRFCRDRICYPLYQIRHLPLGLIQPAQICFARTNSALKYIQTFYNRIFLSRLFRSSNIFCCNLYPCPSKLRPISRCKRIKVLGLNLTKWSKVPAAPALDQLCPTQKLTSLSKYIVTVEIHTASLRLTACGSWYTINAITPSIESLTNSFSIVRTTICDV